MNIDKEKFTENLKESNVPEHVIKRAVSLLEAYESAIESVHKLYEGKMDQFLKDLPDMM